MFRIPELLAPAGGMEQLRAAVENGADAVYMGGKLFNARINAANFDDAEMKEAIAYAHLRGVRLYVTMNTLIKDSELEDALKYAAFLYENGADALIIQDLGFAALVRRHIPGFQLHLSTQGTVYNAGGVRAAKKMGFSRAVLARELTFAEIREITGESLLDIEVFAHGALCISYSGQCQMSREIGGRSGNRGECAQPCRLPYSVLREDKGPVQPRFCAGSKELSGQTFPREPRELGGNAFPLSPKDLCAVEQLGLLAEAGVASLKLEGRMKTPEYVAVVTGIYRKYLDLYAKHGRYRVESSDLRDLSQIFSRGGFTEGYLFGNPGKNLMSGDLSKHHGIYIGKVVGSGNADNANKPDGCQAGQTGSRQRGLIVIRLEEKLSVGDGIEIRNRQLPGNRVTFMKRSGKKADSAGKGEVVTVGYIDGTASPDDRVYKITDRELTQRAKASYEAKSGSEEKALRKADVSLHFTAGLDKPISLKAADREGNCVIKELPEAAEKARTRALTAEVAAAQLGKTGGTPFRVSECTFEIEEGVSVPLSKINELRRAVLEEMETLKRKGGRDSVTIRWSLSDINRKAGMPKTPGQVKTSEQTKTLREEICLYLYRVDKEETFDSSISRIYVPYEAILKGYYRDDARAVPVIPNITKGLHDAHIRKHFDRLAAAAARQGIAIGNLGWIELFAEAGVNVIGDYGLNLFNSMDFLLAKELGIREAVISHEADLQDIVKMDFHEVTPEAVIKGRSPVMTSEHSFFDDLNAAAGPPQSPADAGQGYYYLKDRKGEYYPFFREEKTGRNIILSHRIRDLWNEKEALTASGIFRFRIYWE